MKNIRIVEGDHNIDCKIDGFGAMKLSQSLLRKFEVSMNRRFILIYRIILLSWPFWGVSGNH